jgi:hypothetical protein
VAGRLTVHVPPLPGRRVGVRPSGPPRAADAAALSARDDARARDLEIRPSALGEQAGLVACAVTVLDRVLAADAVDLAPARPPAPGPTSPRGPAGPAAPLTAT